MLDNHFMIGFTDELTLTKEAGPGHPLFASVARGGTMLGRKVRGMMSRKMKTGKRKKYRMKKKAGAIKNAGAPPVSEKAGRNVKNVLEEAQPGAQARSARPAGGQVLEQGADDTRYGGGVGNFEGKQAPKFTDKINPTDTPGAFKSAAAGEMIRNLLGG
jgi:hypothetical protein